MPSLPPMNTSSEGFVPGRSSVTGPDPPPQMALWQELCGAHKNWRHFGCLRCRACQQSTATTCRDASESGQSGETELL